MSFPLRKNVGLVLVPDVMITSRFTSTLESEN